MRRFAACCVYTRRYAIRAGRERQRRGFVRSSLRADILNAMGDVNEDPHGEIERARRDPRLGHGREAVIADWRSAMDSAERVRRLADWGLQELRESEERERLRLSDASHDADYAARALLAARQRAALAIAEADNQMVELNAMTLVAMMSATDALVEELVPQAHQMLVEWRVREAMNRVARELPERVSRLAEEELDRARGLLISAMTEELGEIDGVPRGAGVKRWELPLAKVGLGAPKGRPIPDDMAQALGQMIQLRHTIVHRAARVDARALENAPSLPYAAGDLVRIDHAGYKRYSAALWTYGEEILHRMGFGPSALDGWAMNYTINA
jgi:hypothetical protein